jgi:hypothetical protein
MGIRAAIGVLLSLVLVSAQCSSRSDPAYIHLPAEEGFIELGSGPVGEKEPSHFWLFGGNTPFDAAGTRIAARLSSHGWAVDIDRVSVLASDPKHDTCVQFWNIAASDDPYASHFMQLLDTSHPKLALDAKRYPTLIYAVVTKCA